MLNPVTHAKAEVFVGCFKNPEEGIPHFDRRHRESFMEEKTTELHFEK